MTRRIKICTESPLPVVKAWYPLKQSIDTIYQLKYGLTHDLAVLVNNKHKRSDIDLQIEGFDLLDGSSVEILDLEKDVLTIKLKPKSSAAGHKRSGDDLDIRERKKRKIGSTVSLSRAGSSLPLDNGKGSSHKKRKRTAQSAPLSHQNAIQQHTKKKVVPTKPSSSESSDSSDDSSTSEGSTPSTTSSDSSSSSDSSDSDTSTAGPNVKVGMVAASSSSHRPGPDLGASPVQNLAIAFMPTLSVSTRPSPHGLPLMSSPFHDFSSTPSTPPGQGKKSTRDRNQRRRANRKSAKETETATRLPHEALATTAGVTPVTKLSSASVPLAIAVPKAMANKNKRKGFRQAMDGVTGTKTVYSDVLEDTSMTIEPMEIESDPRGSSPALAAPTQDLRATPAKSTKPSRASDNTIRLPPLPPSRMTSLASNIIITSRWFQTPSRQEDMKQLRRESKRLSDHPPALESAPLIGPNDQTIPMADWDTLTSIHKKSERLGQDGFTALSPGNILAWEGLELDETTWQPEVRLCLGRIQTIESDGITLRPLRRPMEASEEDLVSEEIDDRSAPEESEETPALITLTKQDVCRGDYTVVQ